MKLEKKILEEKEYILDLRRHFHQHPELSGEEYETAKRIEAELDQFGLEHVRVGKTGVAAVLHGTKANPASESQVKNLVLRADIDALRIQEKNQVDYCSVNPGVMHACGHDAHTAALLGAAKVLNEGKDSFSGKVTFLFQQAEETGSGARQFIEAGYLADADRVFGIHMASYLPTGTLSVKRGECNASCDYFKITVHGKSAHVSRPHEGIDALFIASQIVVSIQSIVARLNNPLQPAVVGIGKMTAGSNYNIIAKEAVLEGTTRAFNEETRKLINENVVRIAKSIAETYEAEAEVTFVDYASPLVNDEEANKEAAEMAAEIVGSDHVITDGDKYMAADDFAEYLKETKGQYIFVGSGNGTTTSYPHHHENFDVDEDAVLIAANLYTAYVKKML